ncbi:hypothetical protein QBC32DRAFT_207823 [Pseudoneurospora amorphoporcata]|uniref:Uncharacterized protein n=1 Tax=Pseudoneurospora amorphoporcata TaxID=241081 RepID=A0AAN6P0C8_9PEZI|nr:hypothetical protein QBC32DRAFT_207823 [Pseudoneurospora amorphoporcata]
MFEQATQLLKDIVGKYPWVSEVAAILPLSALIDFIDVPQKLHIHQLMSAVPLWSWPVTPSGSQLLLLEEAPKQRECVLDRFGRSISLHGLDGRYGDDYLVANPETVRLVLDSLPVTDIPNNHDNMKESNLRLQNLEVNSKERGVPAQDGPSRSRSWTLSSWLSRTSSASISYQVTSFLGWIAFLGCLIAAIFFRLHIATAFFALMPTTGLAVTLMYPGSPRRLLNSHKPSEYNRMVVVAEHMNATDWVVFYGESTLVNSLLNTPLEPAGRQGASTKNKKLPLLRTILRVFVLGQWGLAIAAAATKDWNAFFISFWIIFCNVTHAYVIPPRHQAGAWASAKRGADLLLKRYAMTVSSRRALLSTLLALNPDSFGETAAQTEVTVKKGAENTSTQSPFPDGTTKFLDPILKPGRARSAWEQATLEALREITPQLFQSPHEEWNVRYREQYEGQFYWKRFIAEGISLAASIREQGGLDKSGRKVGFGPRAEP